MSLRVLQRDFGAWLKSGGEEVCAATVNTPGLGVYLNNYRAQLAACLESSFPVTRDWIGGEAFHEAVVFHVDRVPPNSWTLDAYARDFPASLGLLYPTDPEVIELASLELALGEAFVGPDSPEPQPDMLESVDWDRAIFQLAPTMDLLPRTTNAPAIWSAIIAGKSPPAAEFLPESGALLVWRQGLTSQFRAIEQTEERALLLARSGAPFADLCAQLAAELGEDEGIAQAGAILAQWLADGLIVAIKSDFL